MDRHPQVDYVAPITQQVRQHAVHAKVQLQPAQQDHRDGDAKDDASAPDPKAPCQR